MLEALIFITLPMFGMVIVYALFWLIAIILKIFKIRLD